MLQHQFGSGHGFLVSGAQLADMAAQTGVADVQLDEAFEMSGESPEIGFNGAQLVHFVLPGFGGAQCTSGPMIICQLATEIYDCATTPRVRARGWKADISANDMRTSANAFRAPQPRPVS